VSEDAASRGRLPDDQVRSMFDRIAGVYDLGNQVMTAGLHHTWRARAADLAEVGPGSAVLDVATGTGDLALELHRRGCTVTGSDFSEEMLARAREKAAEKAASGPGISFEWGDAQALPYRDGMFDAATVGFGARNFGDLALGIGEMARVVRPGGKVVILEITIPTRPPLSSFFSLWFDRVVPLLGRIADDDAYTYLPSSVRRFPSPEGLAEVMAGAGLAKVRWILTAGGIIALHVGEMA
jgi:demethylmenaquinone methyltransferase/2-methoxy-6-polyprenyl-1,4-benzoquinol methylase